MAWEINYSSTPRVFTSHVCTRHLSRSSVILSILLPLGAALDRLCCLNSAFLLLCVNGTRGIGWSVQILELRALLGSVARFVSRTQIYEQHVKDAWRFMSALDVDASTKAFYLKGYLQAHQFAIEFEADLRQELRFKKSGYRQERRGVSPYPSFTDAGFPACTPRRLRHHQ